MDDDRINITWSNQQRPPQSLQPGLPCCAHNALSPERERAMAERIGAQTWSLPTGHSPFLAQPEALADIIESAVRAPD